MFLKVHIVLLPIKNYYIGCAGLNSVAVMAVERYIVVCKPWKQFTFGKKEAVIGE